MDDMSPLPPIVQKPSQTILNTLLTSEAVAQVISCQSSRFYVNHAFEGVAYED